MHVHDGNVFVKISKVIVQPYTAIRYIGIVSFILYTCGNFVLYIAILCCIFLTIKLKAVATGTVHVGPLWTAPLSGEHYLFRGFGFCVNNNYIYI